MTVHFKQYYSYKITINAATNSNGTPPAIFFFNLNNGGNGSNTLCTGPTVFSQPTGSLVQPVPISGNSFTDYVINYDLLPSSEDYLIVGAICSSTTAPLQTFLIRKITIVETPPPPTFTLPSTVTIPCGSTDPQTFTITNQYSSPGVTGYTWNLGASNGWLYNGNPAPATISTATNTLTLTPVCGITPNDISATVAIGSSNYNTNTLKPTITAPPLVINGSDNICSGSQTYTATGVPCGAVVTWSVSPSGIVNITPNGNQVTLTKVNDGSVTLTASLTTPCNGSVSKSISAGILMSGNVNNGGQNTPLYTVNSVAAGSTLVSFSWPGVSSINCVQSSTNPPISQTGFIYYPSSSSFWFTLTNGETINVQFSGTASCGAVSATRTFNVPGYYTISPNPATNTVFITANNTEEQYPKALPENNSASVNTHYIQTIRVYDALGKLAMQPVTNRHLTKAQIDVSGLAAGIYFVEISDGGYKETQRLVVSR
jgi:hypothetical protein